MPDHGVRLPPRTWYQAAPGILGSPPYGWTGSQPYNSQWLPSSSLFPAEGFAYERLDWDRLAQQAKGLGKKVEHLSNPPFMGAGQMLQSGVPSWMTRTGGGPAARVKRILRGFVRRREVDKSKPESFVRLFFMFNPAEILRSYVSIVDNPAADVTGSLGIASPNEPIAAPAMTQVNFDLFFDRGVEIACIANHPGVLIDLQTFDTVVRNSSVGTRTGVSSKYDAMTVAAFGSSSPKAPDVANVDANEDYDFATNSAQSLIIDNSILVDVVFSPYLAFEGKIMEASAMFDKFNHRMTPSRMTLSLTMNLLRITKDVNQTEAAQDLTAQGTVFNPGAFSLAPKSTQAGANAANLAGRANMASWAIQQAGKKYSGNLRAQGAPCHADQESIFDCSSLMNRAFRAVGWDEALGLKGVCAGGGPDSGAIIRVAQSRTDVWQVTAIGHQELGPVLQRLQIGDVIVHGDVGGKQGHVVIFTGFAEFGPNNAAGAPTPPSTSAIMTKKILNIVQAASTKLGVIQSKKSGEDIRKDGHTHILRANPIKVGSQATARSGAS